MLSNENHGFANANRELLDGRIGMLESFLSNPNSVVMTIDRQTAERWVMEMKTLKRAFDRYEACFKDEQDTKRRYEKQIMEIRLAEMRANRQS